MANWAITCQQPKGTNKAKLRINDILLHQAGLEPDVLFYRYVRDSVTHQPNPAIISAEKPGFTIRVGRQFISEK